MSPTNPPDGLHSFDSALQLCAVTDDRYSGQIPAQWANFVGPFGGILAANLLQAVCRNPARLGEPLALTVNFGGPVASAPFEIVTRATCTNRSTQHWSIELHQNGQTPLTGTAVFAARRDTWSTQEAVFPVIEGPDQLPPTVAEGLPAWVANYDLRVASGGMSFLNDPPAEQDSSETLLWVRDSSPRPLDYPALAALSDIFFPRIFVRRPAFVAVGTVSISTYFHTDSAQLDSQGEQFLLGKAWGKRFHNGFFDHSAELWGHNGSLLASTHQIVYYKE